MGEKPAERPDAGDDWREETLFPFLKKLGDTLPEEFVKEATAYLDKIREKPASDA